MNTAQDAATGRANPDDEAHLRADFAEFYDAGLGSLADAAMRWVATGEDFDRLRGETNKAGAITVTPDGPYGAKNKLDQVLRLWKGPGHAPQARPHRRAFLAEPTREIACTWRYAVLVAGNLWTTGTAIAGPYDANKPDSLGHSVSDVFVAIMSSHWATTGHYPALEFQDALLRELHPPPFSALQHYLRTRYGFSSSSIKHSLNARDYFIRHADQITAHFEFASEFALALADLNVVQEGYTGWVIAGLGKTKNNPNRTEKGDPALRALASIPEHQLAEHLSAHFLKASTLKALALLDLLALRAGEPGRELIRQRLAHEKVTDVREALERALRVERDEITDDENGYAAMDGSRVAIPPVPAIEPEFPPPESVRADMDRCRLAINDGIARHNEQRKRWYEDAVARGQPVHPFREDPPLASEGVDAMMRIAREGLRPPPRESDTYHKEIYRLKKTSGYSWEGKVKVWSARPLHLLHLVRLADTDQLISFTASWVSDVDDSEVARRIAGGLDLRTVRDAVAACGRAPHPLALGAYEQFPAETIWPYFAERLDAIDQAFANGNEQLAMATLSRFPKLPKRFVPALINLALSEKRGQWAPAQSLLGDEPSLTPLILPQLESKTAERRRVAAQWLGKRGDQAAAAPLRAAAAKEKSAPVYAAILNALKTLGADLSDYFDEAKLMAEAKESLAKADSDKKGWFPIEALPDVFWADARPLHRTLARHWVLIANELKLTADNAQIDLYLDQLQPASTEAFGLFTLQAWLARDTTPISESDIERIGAEIYRMFQASPNARSVYVDTTYVSRAHQDEVTPASCLAIARQQFGGRIVVSAYDNRGLLAIAARAPAVEAVRLIRPYLKDHYKRMGQCKALLDCLAANGAPAALQLIFATATKSKNKGVQKHASALVDALAEARGWTRDELADRTVPTAGLDETGALPLSIGDKMYAARISTDMNLILHNPEGAKVSALPAPKDDALAAEAREAKSELATAKKELKQTVEMQAGRFYEALCGERVWSVEDFRAFIVQHPILSRLAEHLIWLALDANRAPAVVFRPLGDGTLTDAHDKPVTLDGASFVKLAHLAAISADQAEAWLRHFADYELTPLFPQLTRQRRALTPELIDAESLEDRQGWAMDTFKLRTAATKLGWKRGPILDGGSFEAYEKALPGMGLTAALSFSGSMVPEQNVRAALHGVRFARTHANGSSPLLLADVPPVLLSEVWNDYHDIAAAGIFDPEWEKIHPW